MESWILIISLAIGDTRTVSIIDGMKSREHCEKKGQEITVEIMKQQKKIEKLNGQGTGAPIAEYSCLSQK